jgi:hypothetical protein
MSGSEGEKGTASSVLTLPAGLAGPPVGRTMVGVLKCFHGMFHFLLTTTKVFGIVFILLLSGGANVALWVCGMFLGINVLLLIAWAIIVFFYFAQYSLKTMMMVVFGEGLFISCAFNDAGPVAVTGLVLAVVFPVLLLTVTVLVYDPVLRERLVRGSKRPLLS